MGRTHTIMGCAGSKGDDAAPVSVEHDKDAGPRPPAGPPPGPPGSKEFAAFLFKRLDTDGVGKLSVAELKVVFGDADIQKFFDTLWYWTHPVNTFTTPAEKVFHAVGRLSYIDEKEWSEGLRLGGRLTDELTQLTTLMDSFEAVEAKFQSLINECLDDGTHFSFDVAAEWGGSLCVVASGNKVAEAAEAAEAEAAEAEKLKLQRLYGA